tara:strand:- start:50 stop:280 length:231 start_codon:yes stop_codon:yes gene_type:complete
MDVQSMMLEDIRKTRNKLLQESDWTQSSDSPLTDSKKTEWATYRQNLRDVPSGLDLSSITVWHQEICDSYMPNKPS